MFDADTLPRYTRAHADADTMPRARLLSLRFRRCRLFFADFHFSLA